MPYEPKSEELELSPEQLDEAHGGLNFTKVGTGTLVLSGSNTYTGTTTVNAGIIAI